MKSGDESPEFDPDPAAKHHHSAHNVIQLVFNDGVNCEKIRDLAIQNAFFRKQDISEYSKDNLLQILVGVAVPDEVHSTGEELHPQLIPEVASISSAKLTTTEAEGSDAPPSTVASVMEKYQVPEEKKQFSEIPEDGQWHRILPTDVSKLIWDSPFSDKRLAYGASHP